MEPQHHQTTNFTQRISIDTVTTGRAHRRSRRGRGRWVLGAISLAAALLTIYGHLLA